MKIAAVICELNPMHSGHEYIFQKAREIASEACEYGECAYVAAIMSGNFTQRSEPAIYDKYTRARTAVECGCADIVLELPMPWSCASAEFFAAAGVKIAIDIGADFLVFGSESGDTALLRKSAEAIDSPKYRELCKSIEKENKALGAAVIKERALTALTGTAALATPNDILGIEYIRAAARYDTALRCVPVKRTAGDGIKSASELRNMICCKGIDYIELTDYMNTDVISVLRDACSAGIGPVDYEKFGDTVYRYIRLCGAALRNDVAEGGGGLMERTIKSAAESTSYDSFIQTTKTKKYTDSRIRRLQLFAACRVTDGDLMHAPKFTFLLAINGISGDILKSPNSSNMVKIITKPAAVKKLICESNHQQSINAIADNLYALCMPEERDAGYFMRVTPYVKRL